MQVSDIFEKCGDEYPIGEATLTIIKNDKTIAANARNSISPPFIVPHFVYKSV
jgi:hypothetical protein